MIVVSVQYEGKSPDVSRHTVPNTPRPMVWREQSLEDVEFGICIVDNKIGKCVLCSKVRVCVSEGLSFSRASL